MTGIYFLLRRKKVVYVGMTRRYPIRFNMTNASFDFDRMRFIRCNEEDLPKYESRWIKRFLPEYNTVYKPTRWGRPNPNAGRTKWMVYDDLKIGDKVIFKGGYYPSGTIAHFNKTREAKKLITYSRRNKFYIERIS